MTRSSGDRVLCALATSWMCSTMGAPFVYCQQRRADVIHDWRGRWRSPHAKVTCIPQLVWTFRAVCPLPASGCQDCSPTGHRFGFRAGVVGLATATHFTGVGPLRQPQKSRITLSKLRADSYLTKMATSMSSAHRTTLPPPPTHQKHCQFVKFTPLRSVHHKKNIRNSLSGQSGEPLCLKNMLVTASLSLLQTKRVNWVAHVHTLTPEDRNA